MDSNYSWSQSEHNGRAQKIWSKVHNDVITNKILNQTSNNLHNYPYYQNEIPIYSTLSPYVKEAWHNPPISRDELFREKDENYIKDSRDSIPTQMLEFIKRKREYNKASTFGYDMQMQINMISTVPSDIYPWNVNKKNYPKSLQGLDEEISDFYQYIMPTAEEQKMRREVVERLKVVVLQEWPDAKVDVFGSFKTELYLPTSDIDVVIFGNYDNPLWKLNDIIKRSGIASDCKVLDKATVPIVKMTDKETEVRIDISFNMKNGLKSADLIKSYAQDYPQLPYLVLILKQYLLQRDLNEVWTGGISSYSLILMCVSFLKNYKNRGELKNLGRTLILFLEMYGRNFDYANIGIRTEGDVCYVHKADIMKNMDGSHWPSILCIEDPLIPGNDIGRSSYGALHVKIAFEYAYSTLSRVVLRQSSHLFEDHISILGRIIRITPEVMKYRAFIKVKYSRQDFSEINFGRSGFTQVNKEESLSDCSEAKREPNTNNSNQKNKLNNITEKGDIPNKSESTINQPGKGKNSKGSSVRKNYESDVRPASMKVLTVNSNISNMNNNSNSNNTTSGHNSCSAARKSDTDYNSKNTNKKYKTNQ